MSLITSSIPNMVNGVSQQPYSLRLASQGEVQKNGLSSIVEGLRKRPETRHIAKISESQMGDAYVHLINRDKTEQYVTAVGDGFIKVYDLQGNEKTVNTPDGIDYLKTDDPSTDFKAITVADYTFILNKNVTTRMDTRRTNVRDPEVMFWVKQGAYGATYETRVNDFKASYTTPNGSDPADSEKIATDYISARLEVKNEDHFGSDYTVFHRGSNVIIRRKSGGGITSSSTDSLGNTGLVMIGDEVQRFSDLPAVGEEGFETKIVGDNTSGFDDYYVKFSNGVWNETIKQDEQYRIDASTMVHALVREADGTFTFRELDWIDRKVGDYDSNPLPSFIDRPLNDIFFHRNRLGFVADENVIMSKSGDYWNFFRGTATQVLDDDPIDIGVSHVKVSILRHALPFNETLLLFSDQSQFQLGRADILTPNTVSINLTTEYETSLQAKPAAAGKFVYFTVNKGSYTGVREYYVDGTTEVEEAADVTGHVPKYIPRNVYKITSSSNEDLLVLLSEDARNKMFVYRYYWEGDEKIQASWSEWVLDEGDRILNAEFIESDLVLVVERDDGVYIEVMGIQPSRVDEGMDIPVLIDRLISDVYTAETFYAATGKTHIELPYKLRDGQETRLVTRNGGTMAAGIVLDHEVDNSGDNTVLIYSGDLVDQPFFAGVPYDFIYEFSQLALRESSSGGGQQTVTSGRTQIRKVDLLYSDTGYFEVEVEPFRRGLYRYVFSGRIIGSAVNPLGEIPTEEGSFQFPVLSRNDRVKIRLTSDSFMPCAFLSAEWEAYFTTRSKRM